MNVRTAILQHPISISAMRASGPWDADVRTVEVELAISLTDERSSGPMLTDVWTVIFELRFLPYVWVRLDGKPHHPDGVSIFTYLNLERIWSWSIPDGRPDELLRCLDGCKLGQKLLDTVKGSDGKIRHSDGWYWSVWRPDGWNSRQMDLRTGWHVVRTADRESEIFYLFRSAEFSENALTSGIPVYSVFTHKWFCPNTEWGQNTNTNIVLTK
jgi:hypothetical protein